MSTGVSIHNVNRITLRHQTLHMESTDEKFKASTITVFTDGAGIFEINLFINNDAVFDVAPME